MALSKLEIEMSMNIAKLQADAEKAKSVMTGMASSFKTILAGVSLAAIVNQFKGMIDATIDSADRMNDLRTRSGQTGQELLILEGAALRGGTSLEVISDTVGKLSKRLGAAEIGSGEAARGFTALGMSATRADGSLKGVNEIMREAGEKFADFEDGMNKSSLAIAIFGKGGDKLIPVIEGIADTEERFKRLGITINEDLITAADKYKDTMEDVHAVNEKLSRMIVEQLLPYMQEYRDWLLEASSSQDKLAMKTSGVVNGLKAIAVIAFGAGKAVAAFSEVVVGLFMLNMDFYSGNWSRMGDTISGAMERSKKHIQDVVDVSDKLFSGTPIGGIDPSAVGDNESTKNRKQAPSLGDPKAQKAMEQRLSAYQTLLDDFTKKSVSALKDSISGQQQLLDAALSDRIITEKTYWDELNALQQRGYLAERAALDTNMQTQTAFRDSQKHGSKEYIDATKDVINTTFELMKLDRERATQVEMNLRNQANAQIKYRDTVQEMTAQILQIQGKNAEAAKIRTDIQLRPQLEQFKDDPAAQAQARQIADLTVLQAGLNDQKEQYDLITQRLQLGEERVQRTLKTGSISEIESMRQTGILRSQAVLDLDAYIKKYEELANNGGTEKMVLEAQRLREEWEKLKDSADVLGQRVKTIFSDSFANAFSDFITGTKSMKDAFKSFALSVIGDLAKMQAQSLAKSIFSGSGSAGGLFSGLGDWFSGLFKADGGPVAGGQSYIVGERGPEVFTPGVAGNITPNGGGSGVTLVQNIQIDSRTDQASIASAMRTASQQALNALNQSLQRGGSFARMVGTA